MFATAARDLLAPILDLIAHLPTGKAGIRLNGLPGLADLLSVEHPIGDIAGSMIGPACRPVRAILFDKSAKANWSLGWHQDRTIAVRHKIDVPGFGPWTVKDGMAHVAPPFDLLAGMITLRVHLDPVPADNAPLLVALGSHRVGRIAEGDIASTVERLPTFACLADVGDVWAYSTPILHASAASTADRERRVLQVDYSAARLPDGLEWLGV